MAIAGVDHATKLAIRLVAFVPLSLLLLERLARPLLVVGRAA